MWTQTSVQNKCCANAELGCAKLPILQGQDQPFSGFRRGKDSRAVSTCGVDVWFPRDN